MSAVGRVGTEVEQKSQWCCIDCGSHYQKTIWFDNGTTVKKCNTCGRGC